ncbi:MAG: formate--tetrahydrofolate ligase [Candidatus Aminicenantia bacterium]
MKTDIEIARQANIRPIIEIAEKLGIDTSNLEFYGNYKVKISLDELKNNRNKKGKLIMVTGMTPTPAGEGKTTLSIGLADAFSQIGKEAVVTLREPSLGPVFGMKGGATGGGYAQVIPMEDINLHFTGDIHAVTSAHNLLAAIVDNHIHHEGVCGLIDCRRVAWKRVMDMDDRVLREVVVGIGGPFQGIARETGFDITAASEVMAILCLSRNLKELKERLGNIFIGSSPDGDPVFVRDLKSEGSMAALLKDAIKPSLVQTLEGTPALIHGGPFANIAHGTNSIIATKMALQLAEYVVTETGFATDLGAEKFFDIVVRTGNIPPPDACVLVATIRALKMHGGIQLDKIKEENVKALEKGFENLQKHIENIRIFGVPLVVALNKFSTDTDKEINKFLDLCRQEKVEVAVSQVWEKGGKGGLELAQKVMSVVTSEPNNFEFLYPLDIPIIDKIETIGRKIYGAAGIAMEGKIMRKIARIEKMGFGHFPVCIAKTQYSLSADDEALGKPRGFILIVTDVTLSSGAGFVVILCGDIMTMPGLPKNPAAERIDISDKGEIVGLF